MHANNCTVHTYKRAPTLNKRNQNLVRSENQRNLESFVEFQLSPGSHPVFPEKGMTFIRSFN